MPTYNVHIKLPIAIYTSERWNLILKDETKLLVFEI